MAELSYDEVMADIDARNPTKPGQYTGKPVPLGQKERRPPTVNANRIEAIKDKLTSSLNLEFVKLDLHSCMMSHTKLQIQTK